MAHDCPDCGLACYCGGDIDDSFFEDSEAIEACEHCLGKPMYADEDDYEYGVETQQSEP